MSLFRRTFWSFPNMADFFDLGWHGWGCDCDDCVTYKVRLPEAGVREEKTVYRRVSRPNKEDEEELQVTMTFSGDEVKKLREMSKDKDLGNVIKGALGFENTKQIEDKKD